MLKTLQLQKLSKKRKEKKKNQSWRDLVQFTSKRLFPETIIHKIFEILVFMWNKSYGKRSIFFQENLASTDNIFI